MDKRDYSQYKNIKLVDLKNFFSINALNLLGQYHVFTLEELFKSFEDEEFLKLLQFNRTKSNFRILVEINGTTKILRCKYLNEDPNIDFNNYVDSFGFSSRVARALTLYSNRDVSIEDLFDMAKTNTFHKLINRREIGLAAIDEISNKIMIAYNYYGDRIKKKDIVELLSELQKLLLELEKNMSEENYNLVVQNILLSSDITTDKILDVIKKVKEKINK